MTDPSPVWVMYVAKYDVGRQHSRIIPESVRVLLTARSPISLEQLEEERERRGLGGELTVTQMDVPGDVLDGELAAYVTQQIANEPEFDFWEAVIGDDLVVQGIVYSRDLYAPDGEGGVRELTEDEQAARQRRDIAEDVADEAISRFMHHRASGMDLAEAQREAATDTAWDYGVDVRDADPTDRYPSETVPALPTLDTYRIADEAIERFLNHRSTGQPTDAARQLAVAQSTPPNDIHDPDQPDQGPGQPSPQNPNIAEEPPTALSGIDTAGRISELRHQAADPRAELADTTNRPGLPGTISDHGVDGQTGTKELPVAYVDDIGPDPPCQPDIGL